ncbi:MAG TPA: hypothetical protein VF209_02800 [Patescibacteria group bacterium]
MNWNTLNKFFLGGLVLSLSLGQLTRVVLPLGGAFYLHDLLLTVWVGVMLLKTSFKIKVPETVLKKYGLETLLLAWILLGWTGAILADTFELSTLLYAGRAALYILWAYLAYRSSKIPGRYFLTAFISAGVVMLLFGFLQYWLLPDTRWLTILGWDDHYYRLIGTLLDPNFIGMIYVLTFVYLEKVKAKIKNKQQKSLLLLQVLLTIGVALTFSRSSYLALGVALAGLTVISFKEKVTFTFAMGILFLVTVFLAPKPGGEGVNLLRTASAAARIESSQQTVESNWRTLLMGEGLFQPQRSAITTLNFDRPNTARFADNIFIFLYNGVGILGLAMVVMLVAKWGKLLWQKDQLLCIAIGSALVHSLFNNTLFQPFILLFLLGGILASSKA